MNEVVTPPKALRTAVDMVGSQVAMARLCGVGQPAVSKWVRSNAGLPPEHVLTVERETGISKHLLRPDVFGASPADLTPVPAPASQSQCDPAPLSHRSADA